MASDPPGAGRRLSVPVRRVVTRFAEVVCPPAVRSGGRLEQVLAEFELTLAALPAPARRGLIAAFLAFDRGARLYPRAHGHRFTRLDDDAADGYLRAVLARRDGIADLVRRLRGLVVMCYYELPEAQEEIGYRPERYIAAVTRRRMSVHREAVWAGQAAAIRDQGPEATG